MFTLLVPINVKVHHHDRENLSTETFQIKRTAIATNSLLVIYEKPVEVHIKKKW